MDRHTKDKRDELDVKKASDSDKSYLWTSMTLLAILFLLTISLSDKFYRPENINLVITSIALIGMLALAESLVFIINEIDLSVASIHVLSSVVVFYSLSEKNSNLIVWVLIGLGSGILTGTLNGLLVAKVKINSVITTLGTLLIAKGLSQILLKGTQIYDSKKIMTTLVEGKILFVPISALLLIGVALICFAVFKYTIIGRQVMAVGGNEKAAKASGLNVDWIKISIFSAAGLLASIAGVTFSTDHRLLTNSFGLGDEFDVILAVLIGGVSIFSRETFVVRAIVGAIFVAVIKNLLTINSVSYDLQAVMIGILVILFASANNIIKRPRSKGVDIIG
jgi:ribose transport system permease protein